MRKSIASIWIGCLGFATAHGQTMPQKPDHPLQTSPGMAQLESMIKARTLAIDQAVSLALLVNRQLALSRAILFIAEGRTAEAYAALNPTLGAAASMIRLNDSVDNKSLTVLDPKNFNKPIGVEVATYNVQQLLFSVTANLPIDISGTLHAAGAQAKFQQMAYSLDVDRTRNQIVADVKAAYYDVLRGQALVKVAAEALKNSQDQLKDAQDRLEARVVTKFDVLRAQTDVAAAQQNLIIARNVVRTDLAALNFTVGVKVDEAFIVSDQGAVVEPAPSPSGVVETADVLGPEYNADLAEALGARPEIQEASAFIDAARKGLTLALRTNLPSLNLSWSYLYAPNAGGTSPIVHSWAADAIFSVPIYDGGVARARSQEATGTLSGAEIAKREATDEVTLETEQAFLAVDEARQRVVVANASLKEASDAFDLAKVRYKAGVSARAGISPLLELSDAQSALTLAESNQVNALYDYNGAEARLDRALGRYAKPKQ